jgi:hypothetical protein
MRVRVLLVSVFAALVALANGAGASAPKNLKPYSQDWLAKYHSMYDNKLTSNYERAVGYNGPKFVGVPNAFPPGDVRMSNAGFSGNQNEFQIDINPLDSHHAIGTSNDSMTTGVGYYRTHDFGQTWVAGDLPLGQSACCDPGFAYADDGTGYAVILDTSPPKNWVMKTTDNGDTWTLAGSTVGDDRENIVVDNGSTSTHHGRIYITYTDFGATNEIRLFYSDNQGGTWTGPINVSHTGSSGAAYPQSSQPRVANDGTVYVGFQFYPNGTHNSAKDMIAKSTDGGATFTPAVTISAGPHLQGGLDIGDARGYYAINSSCATFRHRSFPVIGVSPANSQQVYAMWAGGDLEVPYTCGSLSGYHSDALFSRSTDGGATWSAPLKINDDPAGKDQYYPWMDVAPNGTIWVGWHDRRDDPMNFKHIWYMDRSRNGGVSFGTDIKIGDAPSQPTDFIGDYAGLAATNRLVLPMWWDSRPTGTGDPYTQVIKLRP